MGLDTFVRIASHQTSVCCDTYLAGMATSSPHGCRGSRASAAETKPGYRKSPSRERGKHRRGFCTRNTERECAAANETTLCPRMDSQGKHRPIDERKPSLSFPLTSQPQSQLSSLKVEKCRSSSSDALCAFSLPQSRN